MRSLVGLALVPSIALAQDSLDPPVEADLLLSLFASGLNGPTAADFLPDGRMVIIQLTGEVYLYDGSNLAIAGNIPVDVASERGLLGVAVDPMFEQSNRLYFYYSRQGAPGDNRHRVAHATLDPGTGQLDVANRTEILEGLIGVANHNGGGITFGPDGYVYAGVGDRGCNCGCAPGQGDNYFPTCLTNKNGKILRIDREGAVPADNPLVGAAAVAECGAGATCQAASTFPSTMAAPATEIWGWGFRNPWRFTFDPLTGYLWVGDVGEVTWEEITIATSGGQHHGWPFREGAEGLSNDMCSTVTPEFGACVEPVFAYNHDESPAAGQGSVTGGAFSSHCSWPAPWRGLYWFGDYNKTRIWTLTPNAARDGIEPNSRRLIVRGSNGPVHFTVGPDGAIYVVTINDGEIWRIAPETPAPCDPPDAGVVDTGALDTGVDAGAPEDTGVGIDIIEEDDGCGCTSAREGASEWIVLALVLALSANLSFRRR